MHKTILIVSTLAIMALRPIAAQAPEPSRALVVTAENITALALAVPRGGDPRMLMQGDVVRYRLTFTNTTADSVRKVQFSDHIPAGLRYVPGSAGPDRQDFLIEFSADGGRSFSTTPEIEVIEDGKKVRRPAPSESYTDVRWTCRGWVKSRAQVSAEFRLQLPVGTVASRH